MSPEYLVEIGEECQQKVTVLQPIGFSVAKVAATSVTLTLAGKQKFPKGGADHDPRGSSWRRGQHFPGVPGAERDSGRLSVRQEHHVRELTWERVIQEALRQARAIGYGHAALAGQPLFEWLPSTETLSHDDTTRSIQMIVPESVVIVAITWHEVAARFGLPGLGVVSSSCAIASESVASRDRAEPCSGTISMCRTRLPQRVSGQARADGVQ